MTGIPADCEILFYEVLGPLDENPDAHTLVFLHGIAGSTAAWGEPFRALAAEHRLIFLDCLGFGNSPKPKIAYTVSQHLAALKATLQHLQRLHGFQGVSLVGHSMGALLAAHWAVLWAEPLELKAVALLSLPVYGSAEEASKQVAASSLFNKWMALETPAARAVCWLMCRLRPVLMPVMPFFLSDLPPAVARDSLKHTWWSYSGSLREVVLNSRAGLLIQTLLSRGQCLGFVHGVHDGLAPFENLLQVFQRQASVSATTNSKQPENWMGQYELLKLQGGHDIVFQQAPECAAFIKRLSA
jgi:pimeloyl-ACP methyl ester carboxylesterase